MQRKITITISPHARERAFQRYGVLFSPKQWNEFARCMTDERRTILLGGERLVCFFSGRWFLIGCRFNHSVGIVRTFLPREDIFENEKELLRTNPLYRRVNVDSFHVWSRAAKKAFDGLSKPNSQPIALPAPPTDAELPSDLLAKADKLLSRIVEND